MALWQPPGFLFADKDVVQAVKKYVERIRNLRYKCQETKFYS